MEIEIFSRFATLFTTLFVIIDPLAAVPTFLVLSAHDSREVRNQIILKACIFGAASLALFSLLGTSLFNLLGLNLDAFRVGGGLLLLLTALEMLQAKKKQCGCSQDELNAATEREDISFVPLAMPMLAGPGAITSVMVFSTDHQTEHFGNFIIILAAILSTFLLTYFILRSSVLLQKLLGKSGISVIQRIMGLLLSALALQMMADGAVTLFQRLTG